MNKPIRLLTFCLVCFSLCALPVAALTVTLKPTDRFFVNDFADVLDNRTEDSLYAAGVQLYEKTTAQVIVVTVPTIDGADIGEYSVALGRAWGVGSSETNNGIVLLLAVQEREVHIAVGYGLEGAVTDGAAALILDTYAIPHFQNNDFAAGLSSAYSALVNEVYLEYGLEADPHYTPIKQLEGSVGNATSSLLVFLITISLFTLLIGRVPGLFLFLPGGFGGGGGFRGGGGSFGGGGAGRSF